MDTPTLTSEKWTEKYDKLLCNTSITGCSACTDSNEETPCPKSAAAIDYTMTCMELLPMGSLTRTTIMIQTHECITHSLAAIYHTNAGRVTGPDITVSPPQKSTLITLFYSHLASIVLGIRTPLHTPYCNGA